MERYFPKDDSSNKPTDENNKVLTFHANLDKKHFRKNSKLQDKKISKLKTKPNPNPKYKGRLPIPDALLQKYDKGDGVDKSRIKTKIHKKKIERKEQNIKFASEFAARTEILLTEQPGYV